MEKMRQRIGAITGFIRKAAVWLTLAIVLLTAFLVLMRYVFGKNWISLQESVMYFHAALFMLCIAYALQRDRHVRVDLVYQLSPKRKAWVDLCGSLLFLLPFTSFILYFLWTFVRNAFGRMGADGWLWQLEGSSQADGLPAVFVLKSLIVIFAVLLILQGIAEVGRNILVICSVVCKFFVNRKKR